MAEKIIETHPWGFFLPSNTQVLMLGSFPPPRQRWSMDSYYPNIQNDLWRIIGRLFFADKDYFLDSPKSFSIDKCRQFCTETGLGLGDTAEQVVRQRGNASDKHLEVIRPFNIPEILRSIPQCKAIAITGQKAMDTLLSVLPKGIKEPSTGSFSTFEIEERAFRLYRMPSSSRAYPKPIIEKAIAYKQMFSETGLL